MLPSAPSCRERDPFSGRGTGQVDFQHTSLRRTRSRKKRRMQEMEERQRIRGDSHWSKVLQVNAEDASWFENKRGTRMCQSFHFGQRSSFRAARDKCVTTKPAATGAVGTASVAKPVLCACPPKAEPSGSAGTSTSVTATNATTADDVPSKNAEPGILASLFSKIRQWLQSKRRYEVSPGGGGPRGKEAAREGSSAKDDSANGARRESIKEDYLIISKVNNYHPELKRSEAAYTHSHYHHHQMAASKSSSAISSFTTIRGYSSTASPVLIAYKSKTSSTVAQTIVGGKPAVDINIELVENSSSTPVELKSHFKANPLKLVNAQTPAPCKTAMMTPISRVLSRSQQLRQSRNKYMKLLQKTGQLSPGRSPLTGTISAPAKHSLSDKR
ncbi:hypothetical protein EGW08_020104, partial [Elysia chlorotica]